MSDLAFPSPSEIADSLPVGRYGGPATIDNPPVAPAAEEPEQPSEPEPTSPPRPRARRKPRRSTRG